MYILFAKVVSCIPATVKLNSSSVSCSVICQCGNAIIALATLPICASRIYTKKIAKIQIKS